jgi:hypothetical protein
MCGKGNPDAMKWNGEMLFWFAVMVFGILVSIASAAVIIQTLLKS